MVLVPRIDGHLDAIMSQSCPDSFVWAKHRPTSIGTKIASIARPANSCRQFQSAHREPERRVISLSINAESQGIKRTFSQC